jgi:glycosyltransferase involved in cell wall biosynthesis
MSNILYIGPYREFSGVGNASRCYIKSLIESGHNISVRPIYNIFKSCPESEIDSDIIDLESNFSKKYHTVIQHCYPHQLTFDKRFDQNIGIINLDSSNYFDNLTDNINMMDRLIVPSRFIRDTISTKNLSTPVDIVPEPIDIDLIKRYKENNITDQRKTYRFYTIADFIPKKNLDKILLAFLRAFGEDDDVELIIKTKNFSNENLQLGQAIEYEFGKIYDSIKHITKKPKIISGETKKESILYLHNNSDCYINACYGESFGYSSLEALAFNNNIIVNGDSGPSEIVDDGCGHIIKNKEIQCCDNTRIYYRYNTHDQLWYEPEINSIIQNMFLALYETEEQKSLRIEKQNIKMEKYSIQTVAKYFINL